MRRRFSRKFQVSATDPVAEALARVNTARRKQDVKAEVYWLHQACMMREFDAVLWTRLGDAFFRLSKHDEALQALRHALWLRVRARDVVRARVTRKLVECVLQGMPLRVAA